MAIKYENLMRMYNHVLLNVNEKEFHLEFFTSNSETFKEKPVINQDYFCGSIGCIIGHCAVLDLENINKNFIKKEKNHLFQEHYRIHFFSWSSEFTGVDHYEGLWMFLFGSEWIETFSTKSQALARMKMLIETEDPVRCGKIYDLFSQELSIISSNDSYLSEQELVEKLSYKIPEEFFKEEVYEIL